MRNYKWFILIACFTACTQRHSDLLEVHETIPVATISFQAPKADSTYTKGDSINIRATAISTENLHGYDLALYDANTGANLYFIHIHDHNDTIQINEKWKSELSSPPNIVTEVTVYLDHLNHTKKERVGFKLR